MATVETNGIETYYASHGEGPPVVFVHASIVDHGFWAPQVEDLASSYQVTTYDLRGHGRTGGSDEATYTMDLYADDLDALITVLGLKHPVLVGLSMGGLVVQHYAARHPDRVAGLVLADTFTPEIQTWGEWLLRRVIMPSMILPARLLGYQRLERLNVWMAERMFGGSSGDYEKIQRLRQSGPPMATDEFAKVIRSMAHAHDHPIDLAAITAPTLVLHGENELPFVKRHAELIAATLPDVETTTVPDAGHASNLDNPEAFNEALRGFLERLESSDEPAPTPAHARSDGGSE